MGLRHIILGSLDANLVHWWVVVELVEVTEVAPRLHLLLLPVLSPVIGREVSSAFCRV